MTLGAAIPAYRNASRLRECLYSILECAPSISDRITVVDDSGDGRVVNELRTEFPSVRWITHEQNLGFGRSATEAVTKSDSDIVILLNDDVLLQTLPVDLLLKRFEDSSVFAVTFQSLDNLGHFREGAKRLVWKLGMPAILHNPKDQLKPRGSRQESAYAVGGHCAFRRSYFAELNGFDSLYDPFYWEDVDIAIRARGRGWATIYTPECRVIHALQGAIRTHSDARGIREITLRNRLLFAMRHCPRRLRPLLSLNTLLRRIQAALTGDNLFRSAFAAANKRWRSRKEQTHIPNSSGDLHGD